MKCFVRWIVAACCWLTICSTFAQEKTQPTPAISKDEKVQSENGETASRSRNDAICVLWPVYDYGGGWVLYYCSDYPGGNCDQSPQAYYLYTNDSTITYPDNCSPPGAPCLSGVRGSSSPCPPISNVVPTDQDLGIVNPAPDGSTAEVIISQSAKNRYHHLNVTVGTAAPFSAMAYHVEVVIANNGPAKDFYVAYECDPFKPGIRPDSVSCTAINSTNPCYAFRGTYKGLPLLVLTAK